METGRERQEAGGQEGEPGRVEGGVTVYKGVLGHRHEHPGINRDQQTGGTNLAKTPEGTPATEVPGIEGGQSSEGVRPENSQWPSQQMLRSETA